MEAVWLAYQNRKPLPVSPRISVTIITDRLLLWSRDRSPDQYRYSERSADTPEIRLSEL